MSRSRPRLAPLFAGIACLANISPAMAQAGRPGDEALKAASDAYVFGYPLVTMEVTRRVMTNSVRPADNHAPMGQFHHARTYPDASFRDVTAPNADTLYSTAWLDLTRGPYVLSLPEMSGRYFLMPMLSGWTDVFAVPGKRTTGTGPQAYAITGPGWAGALPEGVTELKAPTNLVWILGRTYCTGTPEDYEAVHALQDKYALVPLAEYGKAPVAAPAGKVDPAIDMKTPVREQVNAMDATAYFTLLARLMQDNPPAPADAPAVAAMAGLGIAPGRPFDPSALPPDAAKALDAAPKAGLAEIAAKLQTIGTTANGWKIATKTGLYGTDYLQRAAIAFYGLGANRPQDAIYPSAEVDADGKPFDGRHAYRLHFAPGQAPPVRGFWSLTMYDAQFFFVANPLDRFTVSPRNDPKPNADGSLDLYVQHASPGPDRESNWLPAPAGPFVLMMRLYWPEEPAIRGTWAPPAVRKVD